VNSRYWTLAKRPPPPWPDEATFALKEASVPTPGPGQALTRTIYVSLDPYQWGYKRRGEEPAGAPCHARSVSQVVESRIDGLAAGDFVFNTNGWAEYGLMGEGVPRPGYMVPRKLDPARGKISHAVGVLGMLGLTAYAGMVLQCEPKQGETAVVSAASGGVGQIAGQIARLKGCRVVGIAGREEKCRYVVEELGFDACISRLSPSFGQDLKAACPDGIDISRRYIMLASAASLAIALAAPAFSQGAPQTVTLMKVDPQTLATGYRTSKVVGSDGGQRGKRNGGHHRRPDRNPGRPGALRRSIGRWLPRHGHEIRSSAVYL
jgi:NADPH:quinone reductase-like Zn-dependent oxidoreductase